MDRVILSVPDLHFNLRISIESYEVWNKQNRIDTTFTSVLPHFPAHLQIFLHFSDDFHEFMLDFLCFKTKTGEVEEFFDGIEKKWG